MDIILKERITSGIGFDIGDGITNFIIESNMLFPINKTEKIIIDNDIIKLYEGINTLSLNNKYLDEFKIDINKLFYINFKCNNKYFFICSIYSKNKLYYKKVINISSYNLFIEEDIDIHNIKLKYIFKNIKKRIINKIDSNEIKFSDFVKKNIKNKLEIYENELDTFENQKLMEKINLLKEKFIL